MNYVLFGSSGLRVSELCLGTMTFGTESAIGADYETSKRVFTTFAEAGGNFVDTANRYTEGTSEKWVGEFLASDRDHFVVATKFSLADRQGDVNFSGNQRKNIFRSLDGSLKRLGIECVDLLWLHAWDFTTPVEEVMRALDDIITSGRAHYVGISDTPAWVCSQANTLAGLRGWNRFVGLQIEYSLLERTPERELLPMAEAFGMSVTPWGALGGGALTGKYLRGESGRVPEHSARRNERAMAIAAVVSDVAAAIGCTPGQVALAWVRSRGRRVIPIVGARRAEQLAESLGCLGVTLEAEHLKKLDEVSGITLGFPHEFLKSPGVMGAFGNALEKIHDRRVPGVS